METISRNKGRKNLSKFRIKFKEAQEKLLENRRRLLHQMLSVIVTCFGTTATVTRS